MSSSDGVRLGFLEVAEAHGDAAVGAGSNARAGLSIQNANVTVHSEFLLVDSQSRIQFYHRSCRIGEIAEEDATVSPAKGRG